MKRWGVLLSRAFIGALLLLSFAGNVASADPGHHGRGATTQALPSSFPDDPGYTQSFPDDPGFVQ